MSAEALLLAALFLPVLGALAIAACDRWPDLRETVTLMTAGSLLLCVMALLGPVLGGEQPQATLVEMLPGVAISLRIEPLGMLFALVASGLWVVNSLYSFGYMRANHEAHQTRFYICFALALACTMGIAFSANLLTLYLFYEGLTLVTYPLVTHHGDEEARRGGRVYLGLLLGTSVLFLLPAMIITWAVAGTLEFTPDGILGRGVSDGMVGALLALYMFGIGKAALMPFHRWLPAAMVAPTPVSALLHAVAVVKAGVFSVVKVIIYVFGVERIAGLASVQWLPVVAGFTIVAASIVALRSDNLKRRLAYSTVSQLSYVVLSASLLTPLSVLGAALHIAAHAVSKITLFFAAGAIYTASHKTEVSQLDGIGRRMPWTMGAFTVGALSLIGIPPAAGFASKWFIFSGAAATGNYLVLAVLTVSTLLNAAYFLPIVYAAFFRQPAAQDTPHGEAPGFMVFAMLATSALILGFVVFADPLLALSRAVAGAPGG